jgi:hypothetical protein
MYMCFAIGLCVIQREGLTVCLIFTYSVRRASWEVCSSGIKITFKHTYSRTSPSPSRLLASELVMMYPPLSYHKKQSINIANVHTWLTVVKVQIGIDNAVPILVDARFTPWMPTDRNLCSVVDASRITVDVFLTTGSHLTSVSVIATKSSTGTIAACVVAWKCTTGMLCTAICVHSGGWFIAATSITALLKCGNMCGTPCGTGIYSFTTNATPVCMSCAALDPSECYFAC